MRDTSKDIWDTHRDTDEETRYTAEARGVAAKEGYGTPSYDGAQTRGNQGTYRSGIGEATVHNHYIQKQGKKGARTCGEPRARRHHLHSMAENMPASMTDKWGESTSTSDQQLRGALDSYRRGRSFAAMAG